MTRPASPFLVVLIAAITMGIFHFAAGTAEFGGGDGADSVIKDLLIDPEAIGDFVAEDEADLHSFLKENPGAFEKLFQDESNSARDLTIEDIARKLVSEPIYVEPVWFEAFRKQYGRRINRCRYRLNVAPRNGERCRKMEVGTYTCGFGIKECADGSKHPDTLCHCGGRGRRWNCEEFDACSNSEDVIAECPAVHPIRSSSILICQDSFTCVSGVRFVGLEIYAKTHSKHSIQ